MVGGCAFGFSVFGFWFLVFLRALAHCLIYAAVPAHHPELVLYNKGPLSESFPIIIRSCKQLLLDSR